MEKISNQEISWEFAVAFPWPTGSEFPNYSLANAPRGGKVQYAPKLSMVQKLSKPSKKKEKRIDLLESSSSQCL